MLFLFAFYVPLAVFTHYLAWVQIFNPQAVFQIGLCDAAVCCNSQSDSIFSLSGASSWIWNWQKPSTPTNKIFSMHYGWCDTGSCSSFTNSLPHINPPIWPKGFKHWFVSPKDFIPQLYCLVFMCLGSLELIGIVLLLQQWFLNSNSAI